MFFKNRLLTPCVAGISLISSLMFQDTVIAAPKVSLSITAPEGSAGADPNLANIYKDIPWLSCINDNSETFGFWKSSKITLAKTTQPKDILQFDISVTNEDNLNNKTGSATPPAGSTLPTGGATTTGTATKTASDGIMDNNLYVFLINPNASGDANEFNTAQARQKSIQDLIPSAQIWAITQPSFTINPSALKPYANANTLNPAEVVYKTGKNFIGKTFTTTLLGGPMSFDKSSTSKGSTQGPWLILAVLIDAHFAQKMKAADLQNPQNWEAWDMKPFILGTPFYKPSKGAGSHDPNGICQ